MSFTILIPARLASSRLPGKPLIDLCGTPWWCAWRSALLKAEQQT